MRSLKRCIFLSMTLTLVLLLPLTCGCVWAQSSGNVWTWHNDNWRTGQNSAETILAPSNVNSTKFGKICYYPVDGQVYAQPLVLWDSVNLRNVVYVVTQYDSIYMFDGTNATQGGQCNLLASDVTGTSTSLIPGENPVDCHNIGAMHCAVIAPKVGILGTPVIDERTNHIYLVTYSQSGTNYYHRLHALFTGLNGTTALQEDNLQPPNGYGSPVTISSGSFVPTFLSQAHIQRPGLLLLPSPENPSPLIYVAFSMMDNTPGYPVGFVFRYNGDNFSPTQAPPLVYTTETDLTNGAGGGIWMDGAAPAGGIDSSNGHTYLYFTTADGDLSTNQPPITQCIDCGDSFVKLTTDLSQNAFFAPYDPDCRFEDVGGTGDPDLDFGSGGVLLIPDGILSSFPYLAISADKEGYIWVMDRQIPASPPFDGNYLCPATGTNHVREIVTGTGLYHNTAAFWQSSASSGYLYYSSVGGVISQYPVQNSSCSLGGSPPVCNATHTTTDQFGSALPFPAGTTPAISWDGTHTTTGILWALDGMTVEGTTDGVLWAFNANTLNHLYNSNQCIEDNIHSALNFTVPTISNGRVYMGTQSSNGTSDLGQGTFYIFGEITNKTCTP